MTPEERVAAPGTPKQGPVPDAPATRQNRHVVTLVTWMGLYPTITLVLAIIGPFLFGKFPLPVVTLIITAIVVPLMSYVVMPTLMKLIARTRGR